MSILNRNRKSKRPDGTANISKDESWVITSEGMQGDAKDPYNLELTEQRGANNRVYIARIKWDKPNTLIL